MAPLPGGGLGSIVRTWLNFVRVREPHRLLHEHHNVPYAIWLGRAFSAAALVVFYYVVVLTVAFSSAVPASDQ